MKYCTNCGTQLPDEAQFCRNCGTRMSSQDNSRRDDYRRDDNRRDEDRRDHFHQSEGSKKKTLGEKMMDNFRTNMALQKERRKNFKWWYWVIIAVALAYFMGACTEEKRSPYCDAMEEYAKANIPNPDTYEFDYEGIEKEYKYVNELVDYRLKLEKMALEAGADTAAIHAEDDRIQDAFDEVGYDVACYEYSLHFWYKGGENGTMRLPGVVVARYDSDGNLMIMTMRPDTLQTYPALQMLRDKGLL